MTSTIISPAARLQLPLSSRLLPSSWCPDKDLLVVIPRSGQKDRLSLWNMQGSKKWEVDVDSDTTAKNTIVDIAWSPDGLNIAVAHDPCRVTLHSIQDGSLQRTLDISLSLTTLGRHHLLAGIWWFQDTKRDDANSFPDIFKRAGIIAGSAHSVLKSQPLLDPVQDESQPLTAIDLFSFQNTTSRAASAKSSLPSVISSWPTLPTDYLLASMKTTNTSHSQSNMAEEDLDEVDDSNTNSILAVSDDSGKIHCFLDGSYPIGAVALPFHGPVNSLYKHDDVLFMYPQVGEADKALTMLSPLVVSLPHLKQRIVRDVARVTSSVRELMWYTMRVVKEMRGIWFGSDTQNGARELGPKWLRALETRQQDQFGQEEPHAILDLTCLLATGRASESLSDYLGSGEQMSDRGIQKWETTMVEALTKLRSLSEKRVAPACQRIHLLLEEAHGWSQLSQYALCELQPDDIKSCLDLTGRAIVIAGWLAATARRELVRFKEFMVWLRYESARASSGADPHSQPPPKHDILEVNDYLMSGLVVSPIDKWFMGPVPRFMPKDLGVPTEKLDLAAVMQRARSMINNPGQVAWHSDVKQKDLSHLDRNLDSLIQELAMRCQKIFAQAASATARSAIVLSGSASAPPQSRSALYPADSDTAPLVRERTTIFTSTQADGLLQHLAIHAPHVGEEDFLCMARIRHDLKTTATPPHVSVAVLNCCVPCPGEEDDEKEMMPTELLDAEFFDENSLIVVYRLRNREASGFIAMVNYSDLIYQDIHLNKDVMGMTREAFMLEVTQQVKDGEIGSVPVPIVQSCRLTGCRAGKVTLAVNGRLGRRVACVLDASGLALEILDMEGEAEEETDEITKMDA